MYLKSIEVQGFKSFANKILFEFHNGITGIVGPNGSGKSNVGDAVRWVLGEQSAKQLRGASMQDIIFAGTENRKPLSYAYVAITMDNSDHQLAVDYEEVTVARRVYRSGESEYLLNGSACRLKDVTELFYDTGIGKEGYSIIGQGQIERILNGKPEERRELFDEAAGIVKYKKRKAAAQKKLENERENLVRVNDILGELERQVGPLEQQAQKARVYLQKKEQLKTYDVNTFLLEMERITKEQQEVAGKYKIAEDELREANGAYDSVKTEYGRMEQEIEVLEYTLNTLRDELNNATVIKGKLEGQINVLKEQIHSAEMTDEHLQERLDALDRDREERILARQGYENEREELLRQLADVEETKDQVAGRLSEIQAEIARCNAGMENGQSAVMELLNRKASIQADMQHYNTMQEQINIRKAQLTKRLLDQKTQELDLTEELKTQQEEYEAVSAVIDGLKKKADAYEEQNREWSRKLSETNRQLEQQVSDYHREQSRLESLKNIAERYDGYGNSIRRVMEQRSANPGILGVVSDLIQVEKKYETAIETALGGRIQNIVTADEHTAKKMIAYLKQNRYGRATFLPLTSVNGRDHFKNPEVLKEEGVIGLANTLVVTDARYEGIFAYLLGRVVVVNDIDRAVALAKKYRYTLSIVTLEGESLSPGGSMTGGAFRNSSNLLARNREIEELEKKVAVQQKAIKDLKSRVEEIATAQSILADDIEENRASMQEQYILQNTAKLSVERARSQKDDFESVTSNLQAESKELERQLAEVEDHKRRLTGDMEVAAEREEQIQRENGDFQRILDENAAKEEEAAGRVSKVQLKEAELRQKTEFLEANLERVLGEIRRFEEERSGFVENAQAAKEDAQKKRQEIEEIHKTIVVSDKKYANLERELREKTQRREELLTNQKSFFSRRDELSAHIGELDKVIFRLNSQKEKLEEAGEHQTNYMWQEYELTLHAAAKMRDASFDNLPELRKMIASLKDDIRKLGDVNVNAIEDYKEISERYEFLKTQHDDLIEAEKTLLGIIEELDVGMRKQFLEKFAQIQGEFDKVFKELFGGGKGTLELVEEEDILECGIRIIAQPPGKKLQNMMQMSGGEKSLTAISLLFAIQNLKPSPFCLLDEIEAALDDSNVTRFARYLHKLTKNTQFIVITHRRGTMVAADRLYGITMQEKGVSTLVSVNLIEDDLD